MPFVKRQVNCNGNFFLTFSLEVGNREWALPEYRLRENSTFGISYFGEGITTLFYRDPGRGSITLIPILLGG